MSLVHPFRLVPCLLVPLALAAGVRAGAGAAAAMALALLALAGGEALLLLDDRAEFNDFKAIYAPLHVPDSRVVAAARLRRAASTRCSTTSPSGSTPTSPTMPACWACPGRRRVSASIATATGWPRCPRARPQAGYAGGDAGGAALRAAAARRGCCWPAPRAGSASPRRARSAPPRCWCWSPNRCCSRALRARLRPVAAAMRCRPACGCPRAGPIAATRHGGGWDIIDISSDFLDAAEANASAFAAEAIAAYLRALAPGGIVSIPVSIREFPAYAVRMLATVRAGAADRRHRRSAGACAGRSARPGTCASWSRTRRSAPAGSRRQNSSATNGHST